MFARAETSDAPAERLKRFLAWRGVSQNVQALVSTRPRGAQSLRDSVNTPSGRRAAVARKDVDASPRFIHRIPLMWWLTRVNGRPSAAKLHGARYKNIHTPHSPRPQPGGGTATRNNHLTTSHNRLLRATNVSRRWPRHNGHQIAGIVTSITRAVFASFNPRCLRLTYAVFVSFNPRRHRLAEPIGSW